MKGSSDNSRAPACSTPRGRRGFALSGPSTEISLRQVLVAIEGEELFGGRCIFWREECSESDPCELHFRWKELKPAVEDAIARTTLDEVRRRVIAREPLRSRSRMRGVRSMLPTCPGDRAARGRLTTLPRKGVLDMERIRRMGVRVLALGALVALLTGCIKIDMDLEVRTDDTVSGSAVIGFSKQLLELTGGSLEDALGEDTLVPSDVEGVDVEPYEDDEFVGQRVNFDGVALEEFNQQDDADALTIVREGDTFRVAGVLDFSSGEEETDVPFDAGQFFDNADVRISLAFPGDVIESNGEVDGNRVTWTPEVGERTELRAVASAIGGGTGSDSTVLWIVIVLVALAAIAVAIVLSNRRKVAAEAPADDGGFSTSAATVDDGGEAAAPATVPDEGATVDPAAPGGTAPPVTPTMGRDVPPPPAPPDEPGHQASR